MGELNNSTEVLDEQSGRALYNAQQQSQSLSALSVDADHPFISTVTKISPSPDWFTGFTDLSILDTSSNTWLASIEIDTFPWDAGTDSGAVYRSENIPTDPLRNITRIQVEDGTAESRGLPQNGIFVSQGGTNVLPVAKWTCSIAAVPPPPTTASSPDPTTAPPGSTLDPTTSPGSSPPTVPPSAAPTAAPSAGPTASPSAKPTTGATNPPTARPTEKVDPFRLISATAGSVPSFNPIGVSCKIMNEWTKARHPKDYPTDKVRWSPMVVASHSQEFQMWKNGQSASAGVRSLAMVRSNSCLVCFSRCCTIVHITHTVCTSL